VRDEAYPIARLRRAVLAGIQERRQVLGVDLWQVPRQGSARNTYALEHGPAPRRIGFLAQVDSPSSVCLLVLWNLLG